jgi:hypothetical protein
MQKWNRLLLCYLTFKLLKEAKEAHCWVFNSWRSSCNVEFNPCSIALPSFGAGLEDPARISEDLILKQDVDKRVKGLTKLTKDHAVADLTASFFDSTHPLPEVCVCLVYLLSNVIDVDLCCFLY